MSKLLKNTFFYTIGNIIPQAAGFILLPIYTRYLTPSDYGIVSSMLVLNGFLAVFFTLAVERSLYRLYWDYKTEKEKKDYLGSVVLLVFFTSTLLMALTFLLHTFLGLIYKSIPFYPFYAYTIVTAYFSVFALVPKIYLQLHQKAGSFVIISIVQFALSAAFVLLFVVGLGEGALGMLKGQMIGSGVILPLFIYICFRIINITFKKEVMRESLKFSLPMIPSLISAWVLNLSDRIFIERYFSLSDVGIYSLGYKIAGLVLIISNAFYLAYSPAFYSIASSHDQIAAKKQLYLYNNTYVMITLLICFLISLFSKEAIIILLDARYAESYKVVPIIVTSHFIAQASGLMNLSIYQEKKTVAIMLITILGAAFNIGLNFLLVPVYGIYGAAASAVLSFAGIFMVEYWYARKCYFIDYDWKKIVIGLSLTVPILITIHFFDMNIYVSLIAKIVLMAIVALLLYTKFRVQIESMLLLRKLS